MKTTPLSKRSFLLMSGTALCGLASTGAHAAAPQAPGFKVGIYDSRAVAVAAANSATGRKVIESRMAEYEKAKEAKDDKKMSEIKAAMNTRQRRNHEQAFSTGSVMNIMDLIQDRLPEVAKSAGVQLIVSKWELAYRAETLELVDVTDELIKVFAPSERGLKWAKDIQTKKPLKLDELPEHID